MGAGGLAQQWDPGQFGPPVALCQKTERIVGNSGFLYTAAAAQPGGRWLVTSSTCHLTVFALFFFSEGSLIVFNQVLFRGRAII